MARRIDVVIGQLDFDQAVWRQNLRWQHGRAEPGQGRQSSGQRILPACPCALDTKVEICPLKWTP
jgi:hypothetical protein